VISPASVSLSFHLGFGANSTCQMQAKRTPNESPAIWITLSPSFQSTWQTMA